MDIDVFPNTVEYWGPNGMVFFRNVQVRWMPVQGDTRFTLALERPGASADGGDYADRIQLQGVKARFPVPDLSAEYRMGTGWGYVELAGIVRYMEWKDTVPDLVDVSGDGRENCNPDQPPAAVRDELNAAGVTVNGLPILEGDEGPTLETWYRENVMGGPGSFILPADGFGDFGRAIRQKFMIEISGKPLPAREARAVAR